MEAMALGAVPVVSDIEPNREWVQDGENGFLIDVGDPDAAARKLRQILSLPEAACAYMRERNRSIIRERGSLSVNMRRLLANLNRLAACGGRT
jgi:glycosyltransferase involved in cell wall biosynthesis